MAVDLNQLEITVAQLEQDATVIGKIVNDPADEPNSGQADGTVTTRLGDVVKNVNRVLLEVSETQPVANLSNTTTTSLAEGTNLYYTQGRFDTAFTAKSTTDLSEGTNLYFTDERVDDRVSSLLVAGTGIALTYDDGANTLTVDAAIPSLTTTIETVAGTTYTVALGDVSKYKETTNAAAVTITVDGTTGFSAGDEIFFEQGGAGAITFAAAGGMTINSRDAVFSTAGQYATAFLKFKSATVATLSGDIA